MVARHAGVEHHAIDLATTRFSNDRVDRTVQDGGAWTSLLDASVNRLVVDRFGPDAVYWSGHLSDAMTGNHVPEVRDATWRDAVARFVRWTRHDHRIRLHPLGTEPAASIPREPWCDGGTLPYFEQLDFAVRQERGIKPILMSRRKPARAPFEHPSSVGFMLRRPD